MILGASTSGGGRAFWLGIALINGVALSFASVLNSALGAEVGRFGAPLLFFLPGVIFLSLLCMAGKLGKMTQVTHVPWWALVLPGSINFIFTWLQVITIPVIGLSIVIATTFLMQIVVALVLDALGLLGQPQRPLNWCHITGAGLMLAGVLFIYS